MSERIKMLALTQPRCKVCGELNRMRYPGNDPENGPARWMCKNECCDVCLKTWCVCEPPMCPVGQHSMHAFDYGPESGPGSIIECAMCGASAAEVEEQWELAPRASSDETAHYRAL
jgi:hypothetical protein